MTAVVGDNSWEFNKEAAWRRKQELEDSAAKSLRVFDAESTARSFYNALIVLTGDIEAKVTTAYDEASRGKDEHSQTVLRILWGMMYDSASESVAALGMRDAAGSAAYEAAIGLDK